ncbi:oligosaccharide flippase family protein [Frigoribacterium faeni]|uniref:lipopolysaccharide biosynthesis protein n=1 Tax=Frigoribacterium faeni TaxID=145483 RepID=UPI001FACD576|nr:flippase [Frigoribacterium faeni]MCJ0700103.1 oligosaccharide flippase family protein [Frigoribacterium faeni]
MRSAPPERPDDPAETRLPPTSPRHAAEPDPRPSAASPVAGMPVFDPPPVADPTRSIGSPGPDAAPADADQSRLFGRGLLYVIIWSLQLVVGTVVSPVLAHLLGVTDFGAFSTAQAIFQVLSVLALLGLDQALVLQHAEDGDARNARGLVAVGLVISFVATAAAVLTVPFWAGALGFGSEHDLLLVVLLWAAPSAAVQVMLALLLAEDRFRAFATTSIVSAVGGQAIGLTLLLTLGGGALTYAWGSVISQTLAMVIGLCFTRPLIGGLVNGPVAKRALSFGVPLALASLAYFVLNAGDRIVLQRLMGPDAVGQYQVAYVVGSSVILLLSFTNSAWAPHFAKMRDETARFALAMTARNEIYRLLNPIIVALTLVSPFAMPILVPASFDPSSLTIVVFVVALTAYPATAGGASGRLLTIERRAKTLGVITGVAAAANVGLNLLLVPPLGILGAAVATVIAYSVLAGLQLVVLPKRVAWHGAPVGLLLTVLASVVVAAATIALPQTLEWNIGRCIVALACLPWFLRRLAAARRPPEVDVADDAAGAAPEAPAAEAPAPEAPAPEAPALDDPALDDPVAAMPAHRSRHDQETS